MSSGGGSHTPWWVAPMVVGVIVFMPGFVMSVIDRAGTSLERYGERSEQWADDRADTPSNPGDPYEPPCDVQAVLDALGMNVPTYQESRGLTVDGWVGPQTGAALCAEELPAPEGSS